nr:GNAT family N-acetyltransferase [uncultured Schaedlerella sp.]
MENIYDYNKYKNVVSYYMTSKTISNCFLMEKKAKELINEKKLLALQWKDNLFLFEGEQSFYRMYYFINDIDCIEFLKLDYPIVVELPFNKIFSIKYKLQNDILRRMGFYLARKSARMLAYTTDIKTSKNIKNFFIRCARENELEIILYFLYKTFDRMFSFLPTKKQLSELIQKKYVWICYNGKELVGIINYDVIGKTAWLRHILVVEKERGKGIGGILLDWFYTILKNKVEKFMHWVDLSNIIAIRMYKKSGYIFDGRMANEYINTLNTEA